MGTQMCGMQKKFGGSTTTNETWRWKIIHDNLLGMFLPLEQINDFY